MIVPVMAISNLVLTQQIYSEETNGTHAHYREPVPLRNSDFNLPRFNTIKCGKHSLRYHGPFLWSKLTTELRAGDSLCRFKTKIRRTDVTALIEDGFRNCVLCIN